MRVIRLLISGITVCSLFIAGCASHTLNVAESAVESFLPAIYKKTLCFGPCPAFTFTLQPDGQATLEIIRPMRTAPLDALAPGKYSAQASDAGAWNARISTAAEEVLYLELDSVYDNPRVTDLPATITEWRGKSVTNRYNGPDLATLYAAFDEAMAALNWQPIETK